MKKTLTYTGLTSALLCALTANAAEKPSVGEVELGIIATSGNTETTSIKGKVSITHDMENWRNQYQLDALYKKDEIQTEINGQTVDQEQTTAQRVFASAQGDYKLNTEHSALFIYGSYEDDRFSGYNYQSTIAAGYSDQLFENDASFLKYSVGPGYTFNELEKTGETNEAVVMRLAAEYQYKLSENAKFTQLLSTEAAFDSDENTRTKSETAVSAKLMGNLSLKAAYTMTHNSEVAEDKENLDTTTSITLVYLF
ncbi:DUF481 domain-containing protein [Gayadomonas joobiniege]|uniref:DUF481 domain-containing protein n=1 Tax=Gayadomonas joobiniege TaxID=1234606 RepID=UPI00036B08BA|nr:DUF481 domain-containing protein [Gayadomonas joobiniege]